MWIFAWGILVGTAASQLDAQQTTPSEANRAANPVSTDGKTTPATGSDDAAGSSTSQFDVTLSGVEKEWASIEASSGIDDPVKEALRPIYRQAIEKLKQVEVTKQQEADYRDAIISAPEAIGELTRELQTLPDAETAAVADAEIAVEDLQKVLSKRREVLSEYRENLSKISSELTRLRLRRDEITVRVASIKTELTKLRADLNSPGMAINTSPRRIADRTLLSSTLALLNAESQMLDAEKASQDDREQLATVKEMLLNRRIADAEALIDRLQTRWAENKSKESIELTVRVTNEIRAARSQSLSPAARSDLDQLIEDVEALLREYTDTVGLSKKVLASQVAATQRSDGLEQEYSQLQTQVEMRDGGRALAQVLFDLQDQLLNPISDDVFNSAKFPTVDDLRLRNLKVERALRNHTSTQMQRFPGLSSEAEPLLDAEKELLDRLSKEYRDLLPVLSALDVADGLYLQRVDEVRDYISEQLFWIRSAAPVTVSSFSEIPSGMAWLFDADHWREFARNLFLLMTRFPARCLVLLIAVVTLCITRPWIIAALTRVGLGTRRISTDRYKLTWQAFGLTLLLALPIPLVLFFLAWGTMQAEDPSAWLRGMGSGLNNAIWVVLVLEFAGAASRPGGLGIVHFDANAKTMRLLRKVVFRLGIVYVPAQVLAASTLYGDASQYSGSVGRCFFICAHVWVILLVIRMFKSSQGLLASSEEKETQVGRRKLQYFLFALTSIVPSALIVLAWQGYLITAIELSLNFVATLAVMSLGELGYWMALRWFALKKRQLALSERLENWRNRRNAEQDSESDGETLTLENELETELDLDVIGEQTRRMMQYLFSIMTLVAIFGFWSGTIPLIAVLDAVPVFGDLTLLGLTQTVVILALLTIAVKNLPGVLELAVLRTTNIESGTRYAIVTLCRYVLLAVGFAAVARVLEIDWSRYAWIAAGLSVGLGFGMQEVVTNFVCGIILLFERPIRVGDVVTVDGTTGTVTRIRMRATTITNWDRQELVVPNKTLVTSTFLNWTLSGTISRIVINVGAAYGSDTDQALEILLSVAGDHPAIMEDPRPLATFEEFADSSLNLCLRAYVPDLDSRLKTITELHTEIDRRFAEAGIEIAFPQQDIHLRSSVNYQPSQTDSFMSKTEEA